MLAQSDFKRRLQGEVHALNVRTLAIGGHSCGRRCRDWWDHGSAGIWIDAPFTVYGSPCSTPTRRGALQTRGDLTPLDVHHLNSRRGNGSKGLCTCVQGLISFKAYRTPGDYRTAMSGTR